MNYISGRFVYLKGAHLVIAALMSVFPTVGCFPVL